MEEQPTQDELDRATEDSNDMLQSDLETLNVNVWFNKLESRLQYALVKENVKEGFMQYKMLVLHAELLAIASNKINQEEYDKEVKDLVKKIDEHEEETLRLMKISMIKYQVILKQLLTLKKSNMNLTY
jgi:hypothetical protein